MRVRDLIEQKHRGHAVAAVDTRGLVVALEDEARPGSTYKAVPPWVTEGREVYRRSLILALDEACRRTFPGSELWVEHALSLGYRCRLEERPAMAGAAMCDLLTEALRAVISEDIPFESFEAGNGEGPPELLDWWDGSTRFRMNRLCGSIAFGAGPVLPSTGMLELFELRPLNAGFVLRFPGSLEWPAIAPWEDRPRLAREFDLEEKHGARMRVRTINELNSRIEEDGGLEIVAMSHFYQEYRLTEIVMALEGMFPRKRVVTIAGPSSSGKTTFTKLLGMSLRAQGFGVESISVDNYFRNREETPRDSNGEMDFECLEALDTELFGRHLSELLAGKEIRLPVFDFKTGHRLDDQIPMRLTPNDFLLIEGIHGLNDSLTPGVDPSCKYRIYASALTQMNIERLTRMSTSDSRLLRRMTRDHRTRGYSAEETIGKWPSVRRGERRHIFPFQEMADAMFNSSLPYELPVLKPFAEPILRSVPEGSPAFDTAHRLLSVLSLVKPIDASVVPKLSLLREFIGGHFLGQG